MPELVALPGDVDAWRVGDTEFVRSFETSSTPSRFCIQKNQSILDLYVELCPEFRNGRIVELGIAAGGSTALVALLASPSKLVSCEYSPTPVAALADFVEQHGLGDTVHTYYGIDQGDRPLLAATVDGEFGDEPIDLVIDDASHLWDKTCASFEVLFPRTRVGGLLVIEDWAGHYFLAEEISQAALDPSSERYTRLREHFDKAVRAGMPPRPPLARLGAELLLAAAASPDVIESVTVNEHWVTVCRGPRPLDPDDFRISSLYSDHFGWFENEPWSTERWWYRRLWDRTPATS